LWVVRPGTPQALAAPAATAAAPSHVVTLVTGDKVRVTGDRVSTEPAKGRERMSFHVQRIRDHVEVVPADAVPLLQRGRLDRRLFDVTALVAMGYDERRGDLPLIVRGGTGTTGKRAAKKDLPGFWPSVRDGTGKVWLDALRKPALDQSVPQVNAPAAWQAGYDGTGVTVA